MHVFPERSNAPVLRSITPDEAAIVAIVATTFANNSRIRQSPFSFRDVLFGAVPRDTQDECVPFARPIFELMQKFVALGAIIDVTPQALFNDGILARHYIGGIELDTSEFATLHLAALAMGLPFVATRYSPISVRVHARRPDGEDGIASGVVLSRGLVVTNRHVVQHSSLTDIRVSWGDSEEIDVSAVKLHPDPAMDLAVIQVPGFESQPYPWVREPRMGEDVTVLAYPYVPHVYDRRHLLTFTGTVATPYHLRTRCGHPQTIINAVMPPGASGGPIFGGDGRLVGLVVESLEGQTLENGMTLVTTFHSFIPGDVLIAELPKLHPAFQFLNRFASEEEFAAALMSFHDGWYSVGAE
jgi:S1-C subfamily serine protease